MTEMDELKERVLDALNNESTAIDVFRTLGGIPYELKHGHEYPCAMACLEPGNTRMYLLRYERSRGDWRLACHRCGKVWDAFEAVKKAKGCDYQQALIEIASFLGLATIPRNSPRRPYTRSGAMERYRPATHAGRPVTRLETRSEPRRVFDTPEGEDQLGFYKECFARLFETTRALDYLQSRGVPLELARRFMIGYCPDITAGEYHAGDGIIFPVTRWQWEARIIEPKTMKSVKHGKSGVWNWLALTQSERPVYVTEGIFNALSVIAAGGKRGLNWEAVAIGGTNGVKAFIDRLVAYRKERPLPPLISAMDPDEAGNKATRELARLALINRIEIKQVNY